MSKAIASEVVESEAADVPACRGGGRNDGWRALVRCSSVDARALVPLAVAERLRVLPLGVHGSGVDRFLSVLRAEPAPPQLIQELQFVVGMEVVVEIAAGVAVPQAILAAYRGQGGQSAEVGAPLLLDGLLHRAVYLDASDIHLDSVREGMRVRFRIDGALREESGFVIQSDVGSELLRRIKVLCRIGSVAPFRPQEGAFSFECGERRVRVRVSIVRQALGAKAVLRILASEVLASEARSDGGFAHLGLDARQVSILRNQLGAAQGVILSAGPTGSGKSTLLYRALEYLNEGTRNLVSLEDPVERVIQGVTQIEVAVSEGQSFAELLPVVLRQDPDVILVGEIRDRPSGDTALNAGTTGHLVLSTVHANGAIEALRRLLFMGIQGELVATAVRLIIGQRLVPKNCGDCAVRRPANDKLLRLFRLESPQEVMIGVGCVSCGKSGVAGRIGVYELLPLSTNMRSAVVNAANSRVDGNVLFEQLALEEGFAPYAAQVRARLLEGIISPRSALQCMGVAPDMVGY